MTQRVRILIVKAWGEHIILLIYLRKTVAQKGSRVIVDYERVANSFHIGATCASHLRTQFGVMFARPCVLFLVYLPRLRRAQVLR